jgi:hypothetical protein
MMVKYVHNKQGIPEAVIIPIHLWRSLEPHLPSAKKKIASNNALPFEPTQYFGLIAGGGFNVEEELKTMRDEWNRTF